VKRRFRKVYAAQARLSGGLAYQTRSWRLQTKVRGLAGDVGVLRKDNIGAARGPKHTSYFAHLLNRSRRPPGTCALGLYHSQSGTSGVPGIGAQTHYYLPNTLPFPSLSQFPDLIFPFQTANCRGHYAWVCALNTNSPRSLHLTTQTCPLGSLSLLATEIKKPLSTLHPVRTRKMAP
jgi:hypothetical protein